MKNICVIGSLNMDLVVNVDAMPKPGQTIIGSNFKEVPGGKGANQAVAMARLNGNVSMIGKVGEDGFGQTLINSLKNDKVDTTYIQTTKGSTGVALITVDKNAQNSIVVSPGANFEVKEEDIDKEKDLKSSNVSKYAKLYEQNIGLINGVAYEWIINISEEIDLKLFKKAIEIATDKGKCNKGYIGGIIRQWLNNNIKTYDDLKAYELNQGGQLNDRKSKYAREYENEDESTYQKPTEEQLRRVKELLEEN